MQEELISRITIDSNICHGKPTIRGLRLGYFKDTHPMQTLFAK